MRGLATLLVVPPVNLLLFAICGAAIRGRRPRVGRVIFVASLTAFFLLGVPFVSRALLVSTEIGIAFGVTPTGAPPPQAIVVLGGDMSRGEGMAETPRPGELSFDRLRVAAGLARRTGLPLLVTGGVIGRGAPPIAALMARTLTDDFSLTPRWIEDRAANTMENARFSARLLAADHVTSVYVVTQPWHMRRALLSFAGTGLAITPYPTSVDHVWYQGWADLVPTASSWRTSYYALHEWVGYLLYDLEG